jgi:hypothetical protein
MNSHLAFNTLELLKILSSLPSSLFSYLFYQSESRFNGKPDHQQIKTMVKSTQAPTSLAVCKLRLNPYSFF